MRLAHVREGRILAVGLQPACATSHNPDTTGCLRERYSQMDSRRGIARILRESGLRRRSTLQGVGAQLKCRSGSLAGRPEVDSARALLLQPTRTEVHSLRESRQYGIELAARCGDAHCHRAL